MKNLLKFLPILLSLSFSVVSAQDYSGVDKIASGYPTSFASPEKLAQKVTSDFKTDDQKARAIYVWIAKNVRYDLNEYRSNQGGKVAFSYRTPEEKERKLKQYNLDLAVKTMRT